MRARYKWPGGTGVIMLDGDATLGAVIEELRSKTGLSSFEIKLGSPAAMKTVDMTKKEKLAKALGLHGVSLIIVPDDIQRSQPIVLASKTNSQQTAAQTTGGELDINVPWAERDGTLLLRVMPSDNSCLFTAFGGALPLQQQLPPGKLRKMMADFIQGHPDEYSEAVLGVSSAQYCRSIIDPDRWGGGIELSILSSIFDLKICTYDVQTQSLIAFGEDKREQCILVYSGVHYDRIAFSYSEDPFNDPTLPPEMDRTTWPVEDEEVLDRAQELVKKLHQAHYFTNMGDLVLRCDVPGCGWIGSGQFDGRKHAEKTGHRELSEVLDTEAEGFLWKCTISGCEFIGQGDKATRAHSQDTGHKSYSTIPDS